MAYVPGIENWPTLRKLPLPAKILVTAVLGSMAIALTGALGQIIVHDIIPTFFEGGHQTHVPGPATPSGAGGRGDLLGEIQAEHASPTPPPYTRGEQFLWLLKWTHIHLFGMFMIFIFVGAVAVFLDLSVVARGWLVALPFIGVVLDISGVWLKAYVSPAFFWLHVPGGGLFGFVFGIVFFRALYEMWVQRRPNPK